MKAKRFLIPLTGQIGLLLRDGIFKILTAFLAWIVLGSFRRRSGGARLSG